MPPGFQLQALVPPSPLQIFCWFGRVFKNHLSGMGNAIDLDNDQGRHVVSVTGLDLKRVPYLVGREDELLVLNVSRNRIKDIGSVARLHNLQSFFCNSNRIAVIPAGLAFLQNLTTLSMQRNMLTRIPSSLCTLKSLTELELQGNQITALPDAISNLCSLKFLNVSRNRVTSVPNAICELGELIAFNASENLIVSLPKEIHALRKLRFLMVGQNRIVNVENLTGFQCIDTLGLSGNYIQEVDAAMLESNASISLLDLRRNAELISVPPNFHSHLSAYHDVPSLILPSLFLGNVGGSENRTQLKHLNITHIIRAIDTGSQETAPFPEDFKYLWIDCLDTNVQNMSQFFERASRFINQPGAVVFVHCHQGKSRSGTLVVQHVMRNLGLRCDAALEFVQSKRRIVRPNPEFLQQLRDFEKELFGDNHLVDL